MVEIKNVRKEGFHILEVKGEVDASSSIELDTAMKKAIDENNDHLLINCQHLDYISSAGLGVFMSYLEDLKKKDMKLIFFGLNEKVFNVFAILGLDQLLEIRKDFDEAKMALNEV